MHNNYRKHSLYDRISLIIVATALVSFGHVAYAKINSGQLETALASHYSQVETASGK